MQLAAPAILVAARPHGETAVIARLFTEESGVVAGYVAGGRGRVLRPVVIPGNRVAAEIRARSDSQLPFARLELVRSVGPLLTEPLASAAIAWLCAVTAASLPERQAYPTLYAALGGALDAIASAASARDWLPALIAYEVLLLREMGYGGGEARPAIAGLGQALEMLSALERPIAAYLLADTRADVLAARTLLTQRLQRMMA